MDWNSIFRPFGVKPIKPFIDLKQNIPALPEIKQNNMKKITGIVKSFKAEIGAALTPEVKKQICEDAKALIAEILTGVWAELATLVVSEVEATITA